MNTWREVMGPAAIWAWSRVRLEDYFLFGIPHSMKPDVEGKMVDSSCGLELWQWIPGDTCYYSVRKAPGETLCEVFRK